MILNLIGSGQNSLKTDILIIGGGTVGLIMANFFVKEGLKVVVLESGGKTQEEDEHELNKVIHTSSLYSGAAKGRFRCLGGTSSRWGGALIPFQKSDINSKVWPISYKEIMTYLPEIESIFHLNPGPYDFEKVKGIKNQIGKNWIPRFAKWPAFSKRNTAKLILNKRLKNEKYLSIYINATVTKFEVGKDSKLNFVTAEAPDNSKIKIKASQIVIAAGAIESTRLLLILEEQNSKTLKPNSQLGHYFHDHISVPIANLEPINISRLNRTFGFSFEKKGVMRNMRFELSNFSKLRTKIPPCFAHVSFESNENNGFNALKNFFRTVQEGKIPKLSKFIGLVKFTPWLFRMIWWRLVYKRLLYPDYSKIQLHMVMEQTQEFTNKISLSNSIKDRYGLPLAEIFWNINQNDIKNLINAARFFKKDWNKSDYSNLAKFLMRPSNEIIQDLSLGGGIYHPCGSIKIGNSLADGVVDKNLQLFNVINVSVVATSVLPSSGGCNPTMTLLLLSLRVVKNIKKKVL